MRKTLLLCFIHGFKVRSAHFSSRLRHRQRATAAQPCSHETCVNEVKEGHADKLYRAEMIRLGNFRLI